VANLMNWPLALCAIPRGARRLRPPRPFPSAQLGWSRRRAHVEGANAVIGPASTFKRVKIRCMSAMGAVICSFPIQIRWYGHTRWWSVLRIPCGQIGRLVQEYTVRIGTDHAALNPIVAGATPEWPAAHLVQ